MRVEWILHVESSQLQLDPFSCCQGKPSKAAWTPAKGNLLPRAATDFWESPVLPKTWVTLRSQKGNFDLSKKIFGIEVDEVSVIRSVVSDSLWPWWTAAHQAPLSMGFSRQKNTEVGCHALLQQIFPTQGLNLSLPHCSQILYLLSHLGSWMNNREFRSPFSRLWNTEKSAVTWLNSLLQSHDCTFLPL